MEQTDARAELRELAARIGELYRADAHAALGYATWGQMVAREVGTEDAVLALLTTGRARAMAGALAPTLSTSPAAEPPAVCAHCSGSLPEQPPSTRLTCSTRCRVAHHRATR